MSSPNQAATTGVSATPHPRQRDHVIQPLALLGAQPLPVAYSRGDEPRSEHVLHRLTETEVGRQRGGGHQLGQPNARLEPVAIHTRSVRTHALTVTLLGAGPEG